MPSSVRTKTSRLITIINGLTIVASIHIVVHNLLNVPNNRKNSLMEALRAVHTVRRFHGVSSALPPFTHHHIVTLTGTQVDLAGPCDLLIGVVEHFLPLSKPADRARDGEQDRKHLNRKAHRLIDQS